MKISTMAQIYKVSLISCILGAVALTLIALPMGVFAQEETVELSEDSLATSTEEVVQVEVEPVDPYYDNYKREELPTQNNTYDDFVIGPGRFALEIAPGESKTVMLNVSNRLGSERIFHFVTEDMTAGTNNSETIQLLGDQVGPYTIKDYISVPYNRIVIKDNERAIIPVTVSIPPDAEPGGFYGSILTEVMPVKQDSGDSNVAPSTALVSRIGTLFYVTTPGEKVHEGNLLDFTTLPNKSFYLQGPIDMGVVFENKGSVHLTPSGSVSVVNILGETVGQVELDSWFVMPKSIRTRELSWDREFLMGRYTVTADIERGYDDLIDTQTLVFWVFPWKLLSMVFAGVFVFFLTIRFLLRNFEFKRR